MCGNIAKCGLGSGRLTSNKTVKHSGSVNPSNDCIYSHKELISTEDEPGVIYWSSMCTKRPSFNQFGPKYQSDLAIGCIRLGDLGLKLSMLEKDNKVAWGGFRKPYLGLGTTSYRLTTSIVNTLKQI